VGTVVVRYGSYHTGIYQGPGTVPVLSWYTHVYRRYDTFVYKYHTRYQVPGTIPGKVVGPTLLLQYQVPTRYHSSAPAMVLESYVIGP